MLKNLWIIMVTCYLLCACSGDANSNSTKQSGVIKTANYDNIQTCDEGIASLNPSSGEFQQFRKIVGREGEKNVTGSVIEKGFIEVEMIDKEGRSSKNIQVPITEIITTCGAEGNKSVFDKRTSSSKPQVSVNDIVITKAGHPNFWAVGYPNYVSARVTKVSDGAINYKMLVADEDEKTVYVFQAARNNKNVEGQPDVFQADEWYLPTPALAEKIKDLK